MRKCKTVKFAAGISGKFADVNLFPGGLSFNFGSNFHSVLEKATDALVQPKFSEFTDILWENVGILRVRAEWAGKERMLKMRGKGTWEISFKIK